MNVGRYLINKRYYSTLNWNQGWSVKEILNSGGGNSSISREKLEHLAQLSMISVPEEKKDEYCRDLGNILVAMETMQKVNTDNVKPLLTILEQYPLHVHQESTSVNTDHETILKHPKYTQSGFYVVPKQVSSATQSNNGNNSNNNIDDEF
ncbi:hypothetical protein DLAC_02217 [Tieghemostelium lacteum]|uniref:Glutamyl-tRNA(Gln) amidotransferase subunit C, mitochondrial n=1 Tax=Tieghemostelium lacteum TaxID=361077 RepID=A0A152A4X8_TIELA|nr:hypothetical protein DLAC_02217 [Tieghemostelium lacteum]|eukprot:KYR01115.1 hypothetical protein DLAC_02217 [Tieghemostelium lacteum]